MKKLLLITLTIFCFSLAGCGNDQKTLECTQNNEINTITVENGKITKSAINDEEEKVTNEEWNTLKNFYEFNDNVTTDEIINKLKELNESIGYTCTVK